MYFNQNLFPPSPQNELEAPGGIQPFQYSLS